MDIDLVFTRAGHGPPLVLLHGNGEDRSYFSAQIDDFMQDYEVIALDTRGHGGSPRGNAPFTLPQFAEDLKDFLDSQQLLKIHLLGFSDGANIALLFALKYPQYLSSLIVNSGNLSPSGMRLGTLCSVWAGYLAACAAAPFRPAFRRKKELFRLMALEPHIAPEQLKSIRVPTLVIAGERDMIRQSHTERIAQSIPGAKLCLIKGDHFAAAGNSTAFNRCVHSFLSEQTKQETPPPSRP